MGLFNGLFGKKSELCSAEGSFMSKDVYILMTEDRTGEYEELCGYIQKEWNSEDLKGTLRRAINGFNREKCAGSKKRSIIAGIKLKDRFYIAHSGASRFYLYRGNELSLITSDDTEAFSLYLSGMLEYEEVTKHRLAKILKGGIGVADSVKLNIYDFYLKSQDKLLWLDSNILKNLTDKEIEDIIKKEELKVLDDLGAYIYFKLKL